MASIFDKIVEIRNYLLIIAAIVTTLGVPFTVFATKEEFKRHISADYKEDTLRELHVSRQEYGSLINYQVLIETSGKELTSLEKRMLVEAEKNYQQLQARIDDIKELETNAAMQNK